MNPPPSPEAAAQAARPRRSVLDRWFAPVGMSPEVGRDLTDLARRGRIVFVMRSAGVLNFMFLRWLLALLGLPPLEAALGLTGFVPRLLGIRSSTAALERALAAGRSAVVFLDRARGPDPFPLLARLARDRGAPVFLVPALLVWTRRPQKLRPSAGEILFGTPDAPSRLANAAGFLLNRRRAVFRVGRAADLHAFVAERAAEPDTVLGRKLRGALHYHLAGQVRAVVGPPLKSAARVRDRVLRDRSLRAALEREAAATGKPLPALQAEAERDLREIASRYSPAFIELVRPVVSAILHRLYEAIDVDEEGLARVRRAAGETPIVLCPSHKSYVDFLAMSWVFYEHGLTPPHVAAGINLAFWPFGPIARWGGAFFIRRSLKGNRVYTAVLRAYVKGLLRDRFPQEFYLEGGRSRTGKLLPPKTGLFSMLVDAWLEGATGDVLFVPVAIDYERLLEGNSYARELAGGHKAKEDLAGLVKAGKVLRHRYGRMSLQFEPPVSLRAFAAARLGDRTRQLELDEVMPSPTEPVGARPRPASGVLPPSAAAKRELVQALANRVAYGINRAITMTPVGFLAAALLAHTRRGLGAAEIAARVELLRVLAREDGARFSPGFLDAPADPLAPGPLGAAMGRLVEEGLVRVERAAGETVYGAVEERRTQLAYHKNAVLHRFVEPALLACALRALGGAAPLAAVRERTLWLSRLFKLEFMYRVDTPFDALFEEAVARLRRLGVVELAAGADGESLRGGPDRWALELLADLLRPYVEAYRLTAEALLLAAARSAHPALDRKALARAALEHGRAAWAAGRIAQREALAQAVMENAAEWLIGQGALGASAPGGALVDDWRERHLPELVRALQACSPA